VVDRSNRYDGLLLSMVGLLAIVAILSLTGPPAIAQVARSREPHILQSRPAPGHRPVEHGRLPRPAEPVLVDSSGRPHTREQVHAVVERVRVRAGQLVRAVDRSQGENGAPVLRKALTLQRAVGHLNRQFLRGEDWRRARASAASVVAAARDLDAVLAGEQGAREIQTVWQPLRRDINQLAAIYRVPE